MIAVLLPLRGTARHGIIQIVPNIWLGYNLHVHHVHRKILGAF